MADSPAVCVFMANVMSQQIVRRESGLWIWNDIPNFGKREVFRRIPTCGSRF